MSEKCQVCQGTEDVYPRPLMTGDAETSICSLCYMAWYDTGITNATDLMKYRQELEGEQE